jgi:L-threonylcarbamoyladenylate synthase
MAPPMLTIVSATIALRKGEVVAYPTETFYALGVVANNHDALKRVISLKRRDEGKPVSLILGRPELVTTVAHSLTPAIVRLVSLAWPGPLTVVLPARSDVDQLITGGTETVAVRVSSHVHARILADAAGGVITATSANRQGEGPPTNTDEVRTQCGEGIAGVVGGETTPGGDATTLVRPVGRELVVLRPGVVGKETLQEWWTGDVVTPAERRST